MQRVIRNHSSEWSGIGIADLLAITGAILQRPGEFFNEIRDGIGLTEKIEALLITSTLFLAIYGAVLGSGHPLQALSSAIKLPLVFLASLIACAPTLYIFDLLLGSKRSLNQTIAVLLTAVTAMAVLLFSFTSIIIAFRLMLSEYQFFNLLNVGFLVIAVSIGVLYLVTGLSRSSGTKTHILHDLFYVCWIILFLFMISQVAWSLRPFFYYPGTSFTLFAGGGNLLTGIFGALGEFLGFGVVR
ncbi:MAG: actin-binding WH2 domain-containing protein [Anaerolineae bacterium]|nr:actin-binding WH2 domain-containing protein [Anaerolineae bacterium]